jgi:hypothetical protein
VERREEGGVKGRSGEERRREEWRVRERESMLGLAWWYTFVIPALRRLREENGQPGLYSETLKMLPEFLLPTN